MTKEIFNLKKIREDNKMTQEELATIIGVTRQHIGMIENGVTNPSPELAKKIARTLSFDWVQFYQDKTEDQ